MDPKVYTQWMQGELFDNEQLVKSGAQLAAEGMKQATDHADEKVSTDIRWRDLAYSFFIEYATKHREFMTEDVRLASAGTVPDPPSNRAWGSVTLRVARAKLIQAAGYRSVSNPKAHCAPCRVWISLIYQQKI